MGSTNGFNQMVSVDMFLATSQHLIGFDYLRSIPHIFLEPFPNQDVIVYLPPSPSRFSSSPRRTHHLMSHKSFILMLNQPSQPLVTHLFIKNLFGLPAPL